MIKLVRWFLSAENLATTTAYTSFEVKTSSQSCSVIIPIYSVGMAPAVSAHIQEISESGVKHLGVKAIVDDLEFNIRGQANLQGASILANTVKMNLGSLIL